MMEISTYNSRKIAVLNTVAILLVLLLHSYYMETANYSMAQWVQLFTGTSGLSGVAVPLFYFMSGLLFYKNVTCMKDCLTGIRKRVRSLLVPYILWNIIFVCWYVVLHLTPGVSQFVNSDMLCHFSIVHPLESLEYLLVKPAGFQLWFLRDLMVYVAFTPLLWILLKRYPWLTLTGLYLILGGIARCGITYFAIGSLIALHYSLGGVSRCLSKPVVMLCGLLVLVNSFLAAFPECNYLTGNPYWQQAANTAGILVIWGGYDMLNTKARYGKLSDIFLYVSKYCFFIYLFHEPAFNIIKKVNLRILGLHEWSLILLYFMNPIIMCVISVVVAKLMQKFIPKTYSVLVGGRSLSN